MAERISGSHRDYDALAVILLGGLINLRRSAWTFGKPPIGIDYGRFLTA